MNTCNLWKAWFSLATQSYVRRRINLSLIISVFCPNKGYWWWVHYWVCVCCLCLCLCLRRLRKPSLTYKPRRLESCNYYCYFSALFAGRHFAQCRTTATPKSGIGNGGNLSDTMTRGSVCKPVDPLSSLQSNHFTVETTGTSFNHDH